MKIKVINKGKTTPERIRVSDPCPFVIDIPPDSKK
jgi:hypothetical protein